MNNKKFIGTFHTEEETIRKIQELKSQGYDAEDIYAVARDEHDISMVRGRTDVDVQAAEGSWIDRFMAFLSGEEPVRGALRNMGLTEAECDRYYNEIDNGAILLYVDKDYGNLYAGGSSIVNEADENLGPDPLNRTGYVDNTHLGSNDLYQDELNTNKYNVDNRANDDLEERKLRLHEEKLNIDKEAVASGEVRVEKNVIEEEQKVDIPVSREEVYIERRRVDDPSALGETAAAFEDGESIRIPLTEERLEVTKKPMVSEELIIGKHEVQDTETVRETVKREEADIDRTGEVHYEYEDYAKLDGSVGRTAYEAEKHQYGHSPSNEYDNDSYGTARGQNYEPPSNSFEEETTESYSYENEPFGKNTYSDGLLSTEEEVREKASDDLQTDDDNPYTNRRGRRFL